MTTIVPQAVLYVCYAFKNPVFSLNITKMSTNYEAWFEERKAWLIFFLTVAFSGHAGLSMALAIFGPTQPYLGRQTGVSVDTVNYIWTAR